MGYIDSWTSGFRADSSPRRSHKRRSRSSHSHRSRHSTSTRARSRSPRRDERHREHHRKHPRESHRSHSKGSSPPQDRDSKDKIPVSEKAVKGSDNSETVQAQTPKAISESTKLDRLARFKKLAESRKLTNSEDDKKKIKTVSLKLTGIEKKKLDTNVLGDFGQGVTHVESEAKGTTEDVGDDVDPLDYYMSNFMKESELKSIQQANNNGVVEEDGSQAEEEECNSKAVTFEDIMAWSNEHDTENDPVDTSKEDEFLARLREKTQRDVKKEEGSDGERYFSDEDAATLRESSNVDYYMELIGKMKNKRELPWVDHSTIDYQPFNKNFYVQVSAITAMKEHEVDAFRKANGNIRVRGKQCPRPIYNFSQCGLPDPILSLLQKRDYEKPFPIQMQCIPALMCGRDVIAIAETGSGKTLAFLLPAIRHALDQPKLRENDGMIVLIIAPTRELTIQISVESSKLCKTVGLRTRAVYGGAGIGEQLNALKRGAEIVCGTPGRLIDVLTISNGKVTNLRRVTFVVLDEADRMFDMGFSPQISAIVDNIRPDRQTALFSATFPLSIENLAKKILTKPLQIIVGERGKSASQVDQHVLILQEGEKLFALLKLLGEWHEHGNIIIFVNRQLEADNMFTELLRHGYECAVLHGGQDQTDREFTLQDFRDGLKSILIATSIAARGIDVKSVVLVINYAAPDHFEDYVHRVGRTGRAGNFGTSYTFLTPEEAPKSHDIIKALKLANQEVPEALSKLAQAHLATVDGKQKSKGGFGGKGFKFTESEKSRQQQERRFACKALGFGKDPEEEEEALGEPSSRPVQPTKSAIAALQNAKELAKQFEKTSYLRQPTPMIKGLTCAGYIDANTGNTHDEFDINSFPESVRLKITNKDVLARISEHANVSLQVKGCYIPQDLATRNLAMVSGTKGLYIEIVGPSVVCVQCAMNELRMIVQTISMNQLSQPTAAKPTGRYSVL